MPGRGAGAFATREAPIMDERACGKENALEVSYVGIAVLVSRIPAAFSVHHESQFGNMGGTGKKTPGGAGTHTRDTRYRYVGRTGRSARLRGTLIHTF
jgi:hypothetical protein